MRRGGGKQCNPVMLHQYFYLEKFLLLEPDILLLLLLQTKIINYI